MAAINNRSIRDYNGYLNSYSEAAAQAFDQAADRDESKDDARAVALAELLNNLDFVRVSVGATLDDPFFSALRSAIEDVVQKVGARGLRGVFWGISSSATDALMMLLGK